MINTMPQKGIYLILLCGIFLGAIWHALKFQRTDKAVETRKLVAEAEITHLLESIHAFRRHYGSFPLASQGTGDAVFTGSNQVNVIAILTGNDTNANPERIDFLRRGQKVLLDPWNQPYGIGFDIDGDLACTVRGTNYGDGGRVFVWSEGIPRISVQSEK